MKKFLLVILSFLLLSCSSVTKYTYNVDPMVDNGEIILPLNTTVQIKYTNKSIEDKLDSDITPLIYKYHELLDNYQSYDGINNIYSINQIYGTGEKIIVDDIIIEILEEAIELSIETDGYFNLTTGTLFNLYDGKFNNYDSTNSDPSNQDIEEALSCVIEPSELNDYIVIEGNSVEFKNYPKCGSKVEINLGAISKGYALEKLQVNLDELDNNYLISAGGSSIIAKATSTTFNSSFKSPLTKQGTLMFDITNKAVSTSGYDEQYYFNEEGIRRTHILNPYTGYSTNSFMSITLISDNRADILDGLSTALFSLNSIDEVDLMVKKINKIYNTNIEYGIITEDDGLILTLSSGFKDNLIDTYSSSYKEIVYR